MNYQEAQRILGKNFFGPEDWEEFYGVKLTPLQWKIARRFPWDRKTLCMPCPFFIHKRVKDTHFAFLALDQVQGEQLTIATWSKLQPQTAEPCFVSYPPVAWGEEESWYSLHTCRLGWHLTVLEALPLLANRTFTASRAMLPVGYRFAAAIGAVTKMILYLKKNGVAFAVISLFPAEHTPPDAYPQNFLYGRVSDIANCGGRVTVGAARPGKAGLPMVTIIPWWDHEQAVCLSAHIERT